MCLESSIMPTYSELLAENDDLWYEICRLRKENARLHEESCRYLDGWISAQETASYRNMLLCAGVKK